MLRHSIFSDFYLGKRNNSENSSGPSRCQGSLALSPQNPAEKKIVLCRGSSRTWWENAWQTHR